MNIEMHGLPSDEELVAKIGTAIWRQLIINLPPEAVKGCAVTNMPSRSFDHEGRRVPFLRVYSDKRHDFEAARRLLKPIRLAGAGPKKTIEFMLLAECSEI